jgi:hypothetical protein
VIDETAAVYELMSDPDPELTVPGPGVDGSSHPAPDAGVASARSVGTGGTLALADAAEIAWTSCGGGSSPSTTGS